MDAKSLQQKWKSIRALGSAPYDSLRISQECIPELFIGLDLNHNRNLLLSVPQGINVKCPSAKREHLAIEWHSATRFIILTLKTGAFEDLFNELAISIHERIKNLAEPSVYTGEFIFSFHRWADFFDNQVSPLLPESTVKGIFGELVVLRWYVENAYDTSTLNAWQGPFNRAHDFIFNSFNVEVKTKEEDQLFVHISSEFQLQAELGKDLELAVVDVRSSGDGFNLYDLIVSIRQSALLHGADIAPFARALLKAGVGGLNVRNYDHLRWVIRKVVFYDCTPLDFPAIRAPILATGIKSVRYDLNVKAIETFEKKQINISWS